MLVPTHLAGIVLLIYSALADTAADTAADQGGESEALLQTLAGRGVLQVRQVTPQAVRPFADPAATVGAVGATPFLELAAALDERLELQLEEPDFQPLLSLDEEGKTEEPLRLEAQEVSQQRVGSGDQKDLKPQLVPLLVVQQQHSELQPSPHASDPPPFASESLQLGIPATVMLQTNRTEATLATKLQTLESRVAQTERLVDEAPWAAKQALAQVAAELRRGEADAAAELVRHQLESQQSASQLAAEQQRGREAETMVHKLQEELEEMRLADAAKDRQLRAAKTSGDDKEAILKNAAAALRSPEAVPAALAVGADSALFSSAAANYEAVPAALAVGADSALFLPAVPNAEAVPAALAVGADSALFSSAAANYEARPGATAFGADGAESTYVSPAAPRDEALAAIRGRREMAAEMRATERSLAQLAELMAEAQAQTLPAVPML